MKIKLFTIPNIITLANLICGALATREVIYNQDYTLAFWLIILASIFDFCDGLAARLLSQQSPVGVELDSLADLISFGLTPTFVLFSLVYNGENEINLNFFKDFFPFITLVVLAFSALRLAKFNIDDSQHSSFIGLPTPANAIFCMSLGMLHQNYGLNIGGEWLVLIAIVMSILMVAPLRMFSLKFKGVSAKENMLRYIFLAVAAVELCIFRLYAIPMVIVTYILMSVIAEVCSPPDKA